MSQTTTSYEPQRRDTVSAHVSALVTLEQQEYWHQATPEQRAVLRRIAIQRDRLAAAQAARHQAAALRAARPHVSPDAPLWERAAAFGRLHPLATAAAVSVALMIGPRRLFRIATTVLPIVAKLKR